MASRPKFSLFREIVTVVIPVLTAIAGAVWFAFWMASPAVPSSLVMSAASEGSPYYRLAMRYAEIFARHGVKFQVRESAGSVANIKALKTPASGVDAGFVQGGLVSPKDAEGLLSLGRVAFEPLWVFYTGPARLERLSELAGRRVLVGPPGSGTNGLALRLLAANGVTPDNTQLINRELSDYAGVLERGEADAGFLVLAAEARTVQLLLRAAGIRLMSFDNANSYTQKFPFLTRLELREGVIDLGARIPSADTTLIATTAAVLVRAETNEALVNLFAQALHEVHGQPAVDSAGEAPLFQRAGEFPTAVDPEFTMSEEAKRVYRAGAPWLQRYVPFWLATMIDRLLVSALIVLPLLIPLLRSTPQIYRWRMRRRILHWYGVLKALDASARSATSPAERAQKLAELDRIAAAVDNIAIPVGFADQLYELRLHVDAVRNRLAADPRQHSATADSPIQGKA